SEDTFARLLARIDPAPFARCFGRWTAALAEGLGLKQVAIDGKCLRGSGGGKGGHNPLHLVQAWATENHLCLRQVACQEKSNDITALPELLELLDLKGALVRIDAMGCQKKIAAKVVEQGGDYVLPVKGNQENLLKDIERTFELAGGLAFEGVEHDIYETIERGHGREERRIYVVIYNAGLIRERDKWEGRKAGGLWYPEKREGGQGAVEEHHFMGSRKMPAKDYAFAFRGHWGIENNLHWQLHLS